MNLQLGKNQFN